MAGNKQDRLIPFLNLGPDETGWGYHVARGGKIVDTVTVRCAPGSTVETAEAEKDNFFNRRIMDRQLAKRRV